MGLFSSKSKSSSTTKNETFNTSQSLGDLSTGNIQSSGDVTINGLWGEDMSGFLQSVKELTSGALSAADAATTSNSNLAGAAIAEVARGYQSAYSPATGALQQLKPVLLAGLGFLMLLTAPKILKRL